MGAARRQEEAHRMLTPIVTEVSRAAEAIVRDTFIREFEAGEPRERITGANVIGLAAHRAQRSRPLAAPARAA